MGAHDAHVGCPKREKEKSQMPALEIKKQEA